MSSIAIPSRRSQSDIGLRFTGDLDSQIGIIAPALEAPPGWFGRALGGLRKAVRYAFLGLLLTVAAVLLLGFVLDLLTHLWFLPVVLAWQALTAKRKSKPATALDAMTPVRTADEPMMPVDVRGCIRTRRG
ncbi:MAG TPA: hypothetical protein VIT43_13950 [Candidatus Dormibacteraeota bacterium]